MPRYFFYTSAVFNHYHAEVGSSAVDAILAEASNTALVSRLAITELCSVFATHVRAGSISAGQSKAVQNLVIHDLVHGNLKLLRVTELHFERGEQMMASLGLSIGLRTLDALHLAIAVETHQHKPLDYFVTSDKKLLSAARAVGFSTIDPEI